MDYAKQRDLLFRAFKAGAIACISLSIVIETGAVGCILLYIAARYASRFRPSDLYGYAVISPDRRAHVQPGYRRNVLIWHDRFTYRISLDQKPFRLYEPTGTENTVFEVLVPGFPEQTVVLVLRRGPNQEAFAVGLQENDQDEIKLGHFNREGRIEFDQDLEQNLKRMPSQKQRLVTTVAAHYDNSTRLSLP